MSQRTWQGSGSKYTFAWGNQHWILDLDTDRPGIRAANQSNDCVLALESIAAVGRSDPDAFIRKSLVAVECLGHRVEATYAVENWGGLRVRASWCPTDLDEGIHLEIQVSASSVGELSGLEVFVVSRMGGNDNAARSPGIRVQPRDRRSAGFSYDGRMATTELRQLTTLPLLDVTTLTDFSRIAVLGPVQTDGVGYLELAHSHDVARRIFQGVERTDGEVPAEYLMRYGLFGHDVEKGVVIRARIRGLWVAAHDFTVQSASALHDFLETPLPLGP